MNGITDAEMNILNAIFEKSLTMREISIKTKKNINTVKTLVYRLIKKGFVKCEKNDYPCKYRSNIEKDEIVTEKIEHLVNNFFNGNIKEFQDYVSKRINKK